jgi:hypothetical protein
MSNDLIPAQDEIRALDMMATAAADSKFFNSLNGKAGIFSIMLYARELGLPPMQCIMGGMHNIQGKIELSARLMNSMIRKAGHKIEIVETTPKKCTLKGTRKDTGEVCTVSFTLEDAKNAGIYKSGGAWDKWGEDMCFARCLSRLARRLWADVIGTAYVEGEIADEKLEEQAKTVEATPKVQEGSIETTATLQVEAPTEKELIDKCSEKFKEHEDLDFPVEAFLKFCSENQKKPLIEIAKQALKNSDRFAQAYRKWAEAELDKLIASTKKTEMVEV